MKNSHCTRRSSMACPRRELIPVFPIVLGIDLKSIIAVKSRADCASLELKLHLVDGEDIGGKVDGEHHGKWITGRQQRPTIPRCENASGTVVTGQPPS